VSLADELKLERYKLITGLQRYFTELAKDAFQSYVRIFVTFAGGAVGLVYFQAQLEVNPTIIVALLRAIAYLLTLVAIVIIGQITFCLVRWYGLRRTESEMNPDCPEPEWWAWIFEGLYVVVIGASIFVVWYGFEYFENLFS